MRYEHGNKSHDYYFDTPQGYAKIYGLISQKSCFCLQDTSAPIALFAGGFAGIMYWLTAYPFDAVKSVVQAGMQLAVEQFVASFPGDLCQ